MSTQMKQAVMTEPGKIDLRMVDRPEVEPGTVLMRVSRIGVCGSDIHVWHGKHPYTPYPVVQGHEVSGVVVEIGAGVDGFVRGDKVTIRPQVTCGTCYPCRNGQYHICDSLKVMGFQTAGAGSEYFLSPAVNVVKLPDTMSLEFGAMVEPLAVSCHAFTRAGSVSGAKVLVLGAGPIGNLTAQAARGLGATSVMITDVSDYRLAMARDCGIENTVNVQTEDLAARIGAVFGPDKADIILECVGVEPTITQALQVARKGTTIVVVGVFGDIPRVDLGVVQDRELSLIGTLMYQQADYVEAIRLINEGEVDLSPLVTDRFPFDRYTEAYEYIEKKKHEIMKVMISVDGEPE